MSTQLLDPIPVWSVFLVFALVMLVCFEIGFRLGRWWQDRMPGEQEGPTDLLVGSLLALMAFVLAVTMGMAADRYDARRGIVVDEANAIGTAFLQSDYLPEPAASEMKELLREYLPLRIVTPTTDIHAGVEASMALHRQMWAVVTEVAQSGYSPDLMSSYGDAVSDLVSLNQSRIVSGIYSRVPETIVVLLLLGSALALGMVGYSGGLAKRRSILSAMVMILALGIVTTLVIDLDRPQDGLLTVSQQALRDVESWIGPPAP